MSGLSQEIKKFISDHIHSIEQLEILLLLHSQPDREFTAAATAQELRIEPDSAAERLAALSGQQMLAVRAAGGAAEPAYRFAPANAHLHSLVQQLAEAYRQYRVRVITAIFSKPVDKVRSFADAFKLRRDE